MKKFNSNSTYYDLVYFRMICITLSATTPAIFLKAPSTTFLIEPPAVSIQLFFFFSIFGAGGSFTNSLVYNWFTSTLSRSYLFWIRLLVYDDDNSDLWQNQTLVFNHLYSYLRLFRPSLEKWVAFLLSSIISFKSLFAFSYNKKW